METRVFATKTYETLNCLTGFVRFLNIKRGLIYNNA